MRIGMLTQWFDPETGPAAIPGVLARGLHKRGHSIHVLTGFPNYPDGKLAPDYRIQIRQDEVVCGVNVRRVPLYPSHDGNAAKRLTNYLTFAASATALGGDVLRKSDVVWLYNSPITVGLPAMTHTRFGRIPFLVHVQDVWPESLSASGLVGANRRLESAIRRIVEFLHRRAAGVAVISPSVIDRLIHEGVPRDRIWHIPNPTPMSSVVPYRGSAGNQGQGFRLVYAGALGWAQGLAGVLDAVRIIGNDVQVELHIAGSGVAEQALREQARGLQNVQFHGYLRGSALTDLMGSADAQVVTLGESALSHLTTPSKITSLLAGGHPIIAAISGDGGRLIEQAQAGVVVPPGDSTTLAKAIVDLASLTPHHRDALGSNGRRYFESHLTEERIATLLEGALYGISQAVQ